MARKKARSFFKQCKDYVRGITRARKKKLLEKLLEKEQKEKQRKVQTKVYFEDKPLKELKTEKQNKPEDKPLKELKTEKHNSEENKLEGIFTEVFVDKPLKELKTEKHNSEENKPEDKQLKTEKHNSEENKPEDKPLKEPERQDETEKRNSKKEFVENELKNQENNPEGQIQLWCGHCNYSYCKCRPSYRSSDGYCPECGYYKCRKKRFSNKKSGPHIFDYKGRLVNIRKKRIPH
ncbi:unnamed protein product [Rhizophagus irregularis]|uniref:Uncharacterized protein n=1 Tax=Rhizophagus irregularis TaxID=588596 RepID=A0A915YR13_9GLOM|nr:unnamed protein product [Rhizophagus irregularis]